MSLRRALRLAETIEPFGDRCANNFKHRKRAFRFVCPPDGAPSEHGANAAAYGAIRPSRAMHVGEPMPNERPARPRGEGQVDKGNVIVKTAPLRSVRLPAAIVPPIASM